jgi:tol-pal system protein YbgF
MTRIKQRLLVSALALAVTGAVPAHAQLFGESDEVKAARQAHEDGQDAEIAKIAPMGDQIRDLTDRVRSLEASLQRATGSNEELSHQLQVMQAKLDQQQKDFNYRLCVISAQQLGTSADETGLNCAAAGSGATPMPSASAQPGAFRPGAALPPLSASGPDTSTIIDASGPPPLRGRAPGTLGTLGGPAPSGDSTQFDRAMNLMARAQYADASAAFQAYADGHPDDTDLTPQAMYWIGNMAYVQQDNQNAARSFATLEQKYPKSSRAADGMLKLGQSLIATGDKQDGCTALASVTKKKFANVSDGTLAAAANARKASACR